MKEIQELSPAQTGTVTFSLDSSEKPAHVGALVKKVAARISANSGKKPIRLKTLENLGSFVVEGDPALLRSFAEQPEIKGGFLVKGSTEKQQPELIKPVAKYPPNKNEWAIPPENRAPKRKPRKK